MASDTNPRPSVAVVGAGMWGRNHVRTWAELDCLHTICDPDPLQREQAEAFGPGSVFTASYEDVLADDGVDAVIVATPAAQHEAMAIRALEAGKHVLVEKPLALTLEGGRRVVAAAEQAGRVLAVGHLLEYHPAFLAIRQLLQDGVLGELRYLYSHRLNLGRFRIEENALWSFAPHDVALMLRLTGEVPVHVDCHGGSYVTPGVEDVTTTLIEFPGEVRAHIFVSWLHPFKEQRFVVVGSQRMAVFDDTLDWDEKLLLYSHQVELSEGQLPVARLAKGEPVPLLPAEALRSECEDFVRAIQTRSRPLADGDSGLRVLAVLERAQAALRRERD